MLGYEMEIWGWKEKERMEKLEKKYLRWVMKLDSRTPGYMGGTAKGEVEGEGRETCVEV